MSEMRWCCGRLTPCVEADTTAAEERRYDDAELERFVNAPERPPFPRPDGASADTSVSAIVAATSKIGAGSSAFWADPRSLAAAATADVRNNTMPFNHHQQQQQQQRKNPNPKPKRDANVAAAAAAARAALGDLDELSDGSPMGSAAYDRVKPDLSMFALPDGGGPIQDMSRMSEREVAALVPPAFAFENRNHNLAQNQPPLEITNWDTSDSEDDPGSPELRRQPPPPPIRKIDDMWGSSGGGGEGGGN